MKGSMSGREERGEWRETAAERMRLPIQAIYHLVHPVHITQAPQNQNPPNPERSTQIDER
jgi:hypothetical protein